MMNDSSLELINVSKDYEGLPLLNNVNLNVKSGETLCLLGKSGSGKSTLLRIIAGIENADHGQILWNGQDVADIPTYQRNFGLMFQDYALFPHKNVFENVSFGLRMKGVSSKEIPAKVNEVLELVNMTGFSSRRVTDLSGGEQQRIALARSLAANPRLLMLDEPLAALDRSLRMELQDELRRLLHQAGIPVIYVTHDQEEALTLGDRLAILGNGHIEQVGTPEEVFQMPKNRWVAEFLGKKNFLTGHVESTDPLRVRTLSGVFTPGINLIESVKIGEPVNLLFNHEQGHSGSIGAINSLNGRVLECIFKGNSYQVELMINDQERMKFSFSEACSSGQLLTLDFPSHSILCMK